MIIPGLANVDDVDAVGPRLPQVRLHVHLQVLAANMALGGQQHLNVLRRGVEHRGQILGGHRYGVVDIARRTVVGAAVLVAVKLGI